MISTSGLKLTSSSMNFLKATGDRASQSSHSNLRKIIAPSPCGRGQFECTERVRIGGEGNGCEAPPPNCFRCAPAIRPSPSFPRPPDIAVRGCATHLKSRKRAHRARRGRRSAQCPRIGFRFAMGTAVRFMGGIVRPICRWGTEIFSRLIPNHFRAATWGMNARSLVVVEGVACRWKFVALIGASIRPFWRW